ncbi:MAG TPA: aminopeptidase, partial [Sphingomicrobium sp.]|nr:aminopeptidase [Sphingomicrobium sp.]
MRFFSPVMAVIAALFTASCDLAQTQNNTAAASSEARVAPILAEAKDTQSYARPLEARVTNVDLDLNLDFDAKRIGGTATLSIERKPDASEIVLDDDGLEIQSVTDGSGQALS